MEDGRRVLRDGAEGRLHLHEAAVRGLPITRRVLGAVTGPRHRPGSRQQWRLSDGFVRDSGAGLLRKPHVCRWASRRSVWAISTAGERIAEAGRVADVRRRFPWAAIRWRWERHAEGA